MDWVGIVGAGLVPSPGRAAEKLQLLIRFFFWSSWHPCTEPSPPLRFHSREMLSSPGQREHGKSSSAWGQVSLGLGQLLAGLRLLGSKGVWCPVQAAKSILYPTRISLMCSGALQMWRARPGALPSPESCGNHGWEGSGEHPGILEVCALHKHIWAPTVVMATARCWNLILHQPGDRQQIPEVGQCERAKQESGITWFLLKELLRATQDTALVPDN